MENEMKQVTIREGDIVISMSGNADSGKPYPEVLKLMEGMLRAWGYCFKGELTIQDTDYDE